MKKALSFLLAFTLIFSAIPLSGMSEYIEGIDCSFFAPKASAADYSGKCGTNARYSFDSATGTLTIYGMGAMADYSAISNAPWYEYRSLIKTVTVEKGVTSIGYGAFSDCSSLTSVTIPDSITSIDVSAFEYCSSLATISVSESNNYYSSLNGVLFNKYKTKLLMYPAGKAESSYTIPDSVTSICEYAFSGCTAHVSLTIPDSVTSIDTDVFYGCDNVTIYCNEGSTAYNYAISNSIPYVLLSGKCGTNAKYSFDPETGVLTISGMGAMADYSAISNAPWYEYRSLIKTVTVEKGITSIGSRAFYSCPNLTAVTVPDSVASVGSNAFYSCYNAVIYCTEGSAAYTYAKNNNISYYLTGGKWGNNVNWSLDPATGTLTLSGSGAMKKGNYTDLPWYSNKGDIKSVVIKRGITNIPGDDMFNSYKNLTAVTIPDTVTSIDDKNVFANCTSLTSVTIPDSVTSIGQGTFINCKSLTSVTIPDSVTNIGSGAFSSCKSLTSITIPDSVTSIGSLAFSGCTGLTSVTIPGSLTSIELSTFAGCKSLTSVTILDGVTSIDKYAFSNCTALSSIEIPASVEYIDSAALKYCSGDLTIYGFTGSYAQEFADDNGFAFVSTGCVHSFGEWETSVDPDCTEEGSEYRICTLCLERETRTIPATGHVKTVVLTELEPTCTQAGRKAEYCTKCSACIKTESIPALGHDYSAEWTVDVEPGCTTAGSKSRRCTRCEAKTAVTAINPTGHNYGEWITDTDPTCTADGAKHRVCSVCDSVETGVISKLGHEFSAEWTVDVKPGCTTKGSKSHHCTRCEEKTSITEINPTGHSYGEWIIDTDPTCTVDGTKHRVCSVCKDIQNGTVTKLGHDYSTEWTVDVEPGCITAGEKSHHCTRCEAKVSVTAISPTGHSFGEWVIDTEPTCYSTGEKHRVCPKCGAVETAAIEKTAHLNTIWITELEPTCTKPGERNEYCLDCSELINTEEIPALGHDYSTEWTVDVEPGCITAGEKSHHCTRCEAKVSVTAISPTGHSYGEWILDTEPTCTENGTKHRVCSGCGDVENGITEMTGHINTLWITEYDPTCTAPGERNEYCLDCSELINTEEIPALGHDYSTEWIVDVEPGCITNGVKSHHCTRCTAKADETDIPATGHSYGEWITDTEPTCTEDGAKHRVCSNCNNFENELIEKTGHINTVWVTELEPTCTTTGERSQYCLDCSELINTEEIPALGHDYSGEWVIETEPTCTGHGKNSLYCNRCKTKLGTEETAATGHLNTVWITDTEPTCTEDGLKNEYCLDCSEIIGSEVIPATGHIHTEWKTDTEPTCTEDGLKIEYCLDCEEFIGSETLPALGHDFVLVEEMSGHPHTKTFKCTRCSETNEESPVYNEACAECNFTSTDLSDSACRITAYKGSLSELTVPAQLGGKAVKSTTTGALKANKTLTSVNIENGIEEIGALTFLNCSNLEKVVIPDSVKTIGTNAFYGCNNLVIYCCEGSFAQSYAEENGIAYSLLEMEATEISVIDKDAKLIYTKENCETDISKLVTAKNGLTVKAEASFVTENAEYLGTGSVIGIYMNNQLITEYTLIVDGDLNGDSVCDVLDAALAEQFANSHGSASRAQVCAAKGDEGDTITVDDYSAVVNKALVNDYANDTSCDEPPKNGNYVYANKHYIPFGSSSAQIKKLLGNPTDIFECDSYSVNVYANDYQKLIITFFKSDKLSIVFTNSTDVVINSGNDSAEFTTLNENVTIGNVNITVFTDMFNSNEHYALLAEYGDNDLTISQNNRAAQEKLCFYLTNGCRAINSLNPFTYNDTLAEAAFEHSEDMGKRGYFSHVSPDGDSPKDRINNKNIIGACCGENIAAGYADAFVVTDAWYNSIDHRMNVLDPDFTQMGVGVAYVKGSQRVYYFTQNFIG